MSSFKRCATPSFRSAFFGLLGLLFALIAFFIHSLFFYTDEDLQEYRQLVVSTGATPADEPESPAIAKQQRTNISKDIFYNHGRERLTLRLTATHSVLELDQTGTVTEIVEQFKGIKGLMQEELYYRLPDGREAFLQEDGRLLVRHGDPAKPSDWADFPLSSIKPMQIMRYFEADKAVYKYKNNHLEAEEANVARYVVPGHAFVSNIEGYKPIMSGVAQSLEVAMAENLPNFQANQLKATFYQHRERQDEETPIAILIEAEKSIYDGKTILLMGDVFLEHAVGTLSAGRASLAGSPEDRKFRLSQLDLHDHVRFTLSEGGELMAAEAHLSQETSLGTFKGSPEQPFVVYMEECRDGSGSQERFPIIVKSRSMTIEFKPIDPGEKTVTKSHINAVVASENVTVDYNHDFIAAADCATFHREESPVSQTGLSGIICLNAEGDDGHCHVTNRNGDLIHARQIFVDTLNRRLSFAHPKGALFSSRNRLVKERIDFSSDMLNWDEQEGTLKLRGHVKIAEKGLGQLISDDEVTLFHSILNGKKELSTIESTGHTVLTHTSHILQSCGKMAVDHANLKVTLDSPGVEQVFYKDDQGTIYADHAEVEYELVEGKISPRKLTLEGHVKMINKPCKDLQRQQYVLADRVKVFPATQEVFLSADKGNRVLVYDQVNDLQVSAPGLKIKRDEATKKESMQGIGDVRFNFLDPEFDQLHQRFEEMKNLRNG
jgi:hypothetical protein